MALNISISGGNLNEEVKLVTQVMIGIETIETDDINFVTHPIKIGMVHILYVEY